MGLLIWLPLHGNLNNYGSLPITFSLVTTGGGVVAASSGGKTNANCYQRTTINTVSHITSSSTVNLDGDFTMACWCYPTTAGAETSANGILTNHNHGYNSDKGSGSGITLKYSGATTCYMSCNTSTPSGRTFHTYYGTTNIYGAWHHLCLTYKKASKTYRLYVDGICEKEFTCDNTAQPNKVNVFDWSTGHSANGSYRPLCKINDVRVYDHCLSKKEVKLLSQGLVAHYKLDCGGANNLLVNTINPTDYTNIAAKPATNSIVYDNELGLNVFQASTTATGETYIYSSRTPVIAKSSQYTFSCDVWVNDKVKSIETFWLPDTDASPQTGSGWVSGHQQSKTHSIPLRNGWFHITYTFTTKSNERTGYIRIDNNGSSTEGSAAIMKVTNLKLEKGSKESGYSLSMSEMHFSPADDCSGYNNNGTASGTFNLDTDTPRYPTCTIFDGNSYIACGRGPMVKDALTVNWWGYMDNWSGYTSMRAISCTESGGWNFEPSSSKMNFACGTGESSNTYKSIVSKTTFANYAAGWHMFTGTYDGFTTKIYIDGVLEGTSATSSTRVPIFYNASNGIFIGAEAAGSTTTPAATKFTGKMSDVRIYCTALSAEDIKILYETAGSVTKEGGLVAYEFKEQLNHLAQMKKTGVFMAEDFSERGQLGDMKITTLSDGSSWARVFYHKTNTGTTLFTSVDEVLYTTSEYKYSRLKLLPLLKGSDGKYEFMLTYPADAPDKYNRWKQTNAPQNEFVANGDGSAFATGYQGIHIDWNAYYWGGLTRQSSDASALVDTYLSGSVGHSNWFYAIGAKTKWGNPNGVPGYDGTKGMQEIELWVRVDTLPKNSKFNIMKEQFVSGTLFQEI